MTPNGWDRHPVGKLCKSIVPGRNKPKKFDGNIAWITTPDIQGRYVPSNVQQHYVSEDAIIESGAKVIPAGSVIIAAVGELGLTAIASEPLVLNQQLHAFVCPEFLDNEFLAYWFETQKPYMERIASKTTIPYMNKSNCESIPVSYPPLPEQKKIAQILSTWDKAIETVEKLIANSQQKKKALMQQLLTGKKRFPGFNGEWKKTELGELLDYKQPTQFLVTSTKYSDEYATPVLTAGKTFVLGHTNENFGVYEEGLPVIIFDDFTTASKFVDFPFKAKSSAMKILTAKQGVSIKYIFEAMQMMNYSVGGHQRHWISIYTNLVVNLPSLEEQQKISSALSSADHEIETWQ